MAVRHNKKQDIAKFVREQGLPYTVLLDDTEVYEHQFRGKRIPQTYLIDRSGKIRYSHLGWTEGTQQELEEHIKKLLKS